MALTTTKHGLRKPDANQLAKTGDNDIAFNAQKTDDLLDGVFTRLGQAEANIGAGGGAGGGAGLTEDPANPGTYFIATESTITPDPVTPGLYTF